VFKLNNGMSFVLAELSYGLYPKKFVQLSIVLVPTTGEIAVDPDTVDKYGVNYGLYFDTAHEATAAIARELIGKNLVNTKQWLLDQRVKYLANPESVDAQLRPIFEYIALVGLKA
jgi:hypothetical protein